MKKLVSAVVSVFILIASLAEVAALDYNADLSLSVSEMYNDNLDLTRTNKLGAFVTSVSPGLSLSTATQKMDAAVSYAPTFNFYNNYDYRNNISQQAAIRGRYRFTDALTLNFMDAYTQSQESSILRTIEGGGPITSTQRITTYNNLAADLDYRLSGAIGLSAGAGYNLVNIAGVDLGDYETYGGRLGMSYMVNERITLRARAAFTLFSYKLTGDANSMDYTVGGTWRLTPTVTVGGYGGVVISRLERERRTVTGYSCGLSIEKRFQSSQAVLNYAHGVTAGIDSPTPLESHVLTFRYAMPIAHLLEGGVAAFYGSYKALSEAGASSSTTNRDEYGGSVNLAYRLWQSGRESLSAILTYSYVKSTAPTSLGAGYTNNIIMLGLRFGYLARF
jgi:hypothetical protein